MFPALANVVSYAKQTDIAMAEVNTNMLTPLVSLKFAILTFLVRMARTTMKNTIDPIYQRVGRLSM